MTNAQQANVARQEAAKAKIAAAQEAWDAAHAELRAYAESLGLETTRLAGRGPRERRNPITGELK
jgi:hypothetical protein